MNNKLLNNIITIVIFIVIVFWNNPKVFFNESINFSICEYECEYVKEKLSEIEKDLSITPNLNYNYVISKVKYRNIYDFKKELIIFKGYNDNISEGLAVINDKGLIGTIYKVNKNNSMVRLLSNKNSNISVKINNVYGILKYIDNEFIIGNITSNEEIKIGDIAYTSGLGNLPNNIPVGIVKDIKIDSLEINRTVIIDPLVDFNDINYLLVIGGL